MYSLHVIVKRRLNLALLSGKWGHMSRRPTYLGLQVLRVMAAVLVLITHSGFYASERLDRSFTYWETGAAGVDLFFVISGFVMVYSSVNLIGNPKGWLVFV